MITTPWMIKRKTKRGDLNREEYLHALMSLYDNTDTTQGIY